MAAYGLYTHIQSNKRRSVMLLIGLFFLVYLMVYAGALMAEAMTTPGPLDSMLRNAITPALYAAPWATVGTVIEWYDYALYGAASGLIINKLFFPNLSPGSGGFTSFSCFLSSLNLRTRSAFSEFSGSSAQVFNTFPNFIRPVLDSRP